MPRPQPSPPKLPPATIREPDERVVLNTSQLVPLTRTPAKWDPAGVHKEGTMISATGQM